MKRFVGVAGAAALVVAGAASASPRASTTAPIAATEVSAFLHDPEPPSTLVVEAVPGEEEQAATALAAAGHPILRRAGGALEVPAVPVVPAALESATSGARPVDPQGPGFGALGASSGLGGLTALPGVASVAPAERAVATAVDDALVASARTGANGGEGADAIGAAAWRAAELTG